MAKPPRTILQLLGGRAGKSRVELCGAGSLLDLSVDLQSHT